MLRLTTWINTFGIQKVYIIWIWSKTVTTLGSRNSPCFFPSFLQLFICSSFINIFFCDHKGYDFGFFTSCCLPGFIPLMKSLCWCYCISFFHVQGGISCFSFQCSIHTIHCSFSMTSSRKHPFSIIIEVFFMVKHVWQLLAIFELTCAAISHKNGLIQLWIKLLQGALNLLISCVNCFSFVVKTVRQFLWGALSEEKEWLIGLQNISFRDLAIFWENEFFLKNFNFWHHIWGKGVKIRLFYAWSFFHQLHRFGDRKKKSHFQAPFQLFFCINQLPTWENDDFWQKKMSDYFFRFSKCSLWSLKILCLTFNYQLISWCFGVCPIFLAICPVNLRYSGPKSAEKWPFPQQNKIQKKILAKFLIFFRGPKGAPFDQFRCSQWS